MSKRSLGLLLLGIWIGSSGVAHAALNISADPVELGTVTVGGAVIGSAVLSANPVETIVFALGADCSEFAVTTNTPLTVGNGSNGTPTRLVTLRLSPTSPGAKSCTIQAKDAGNNNTLLTFTVTGTAVAPPAPEITLTPTPFPALPDADVGATGEGQILTARNTGDAPLVISDVAFQAGDADFALLAGSTDVTLQPDETTTWSIACEPSVHGLRNGTFRITSNVSGGTTDVALSCTGRQGVVVVAPTSLNFGPVAQGTTRTLTFAVRNDGNAEITELVGALNDNTLGYVFDAGGVPDTLAAGASMTLTVDFSPQNADDGGPATITFDGVWGASATPTSAVLALAGDGQGVSFAATPMLMFSDFRFDTRPELVYQITNTGDVDLEIVTPMFTPDLGTAVGELAFTFRRNGAMVTLPQTIGEGQQLDVTVRAQPGNRIGPIGGTVVVHANNPAAVDQRVVITGNATAAMVTATTMVDFDKVDLDGPAQVKTITLTNTGNATLDIPQFTRSVNPVFTITTPTAPTTLAAGASMTIMVSCKPTVERPPGSFDEALLVVGLTGVLGGPGQAMIPIRGRGIDRHVSIDALAAFEPAFPGQENTEPVEVTVHNGGEAPLEILSVKVESEGDWELIDAAPFQIEDGGQHTFLIRFTPSVAGARIDGTLTLETNDNDFPQGKLEVPLVGDSLAVVARGGGGCSAGTGGRGMLALGVAALALVLGRRRRRGLMAAVVMVAIAPAPRARAEDVGVTVFQPTPATTGTGFQLQSPEVGASGSWVASSILSYASGLFRLEPLDPSDARFQPSMVVERSTLLQLGAAFAFLDRFEVGAHLPLYLQDGETDGAVPVNGGARGNLSLHGKLQLWERGGLVVGTSAIAEVPTATDGQLTGSDKLEVRLLVLGSLAPAALGSRLAITANAGPVLREKAEHPAFHEGSSLVWGAGASYRVLDPLWLTAEVFGEVTPAGFGPVGESTMPRTTLSQIEWLAGLRFQPDRRFTVGVAVGRGVTDALGTPDLRGVLALAFVPRASAVAPLDPPEVPRPEVDSDGDGVLDGADRCPGEAEDRDMFDDEDGCADLDNDRDRVADARDRCPLDPEDVDGFEDGDGCADQDNDGDGIADGQDRCRNQPEDKDGFQDADGCAEPDNDRDGLADAQDRCPDEQETINAIKDDDGCPDKGDTTIVLSPDRIGTLDPIVFNGLKLARSSVPVLAQIGATLRAHSEIVRVRITVHVHPTSDPDADQGRSEKRAQVVRDWLIQFGIAPTRLEMRGFGGSKPLVPSDRRGAAKINERIELIILERT